MTAITFDLTTRDGATAAAAHLIASFGDRVVIACGKDLTHTSRLRPTGVTVWRNPHSYAVMVTSGGFPHSFEGAIRVAEDTEPPQVPASLRRSLDLIGRPIRRTDPNTEET